MPGRFCVLSTGSYYLLQDAPTFALNSSCLPIQKKYAPFVNRTRWPQDQLPSRRSSPQLGTPSPAPHAIIGTQGPSPVKPFQIPSDYRFVTLDTNTSSTMAFAGATAAFECSYRGSEGSTIHGLSNTRLPHFSNESALSGTSSPKKSLQQRPTSMFRPTIASSQRRKGVG